jgi:NACHT domain
MAITEQPAPQLQAYAREFFGTLGYLVAQPYPNLISATKEIAGGKELKWTVCFEDRASFSQLSNPQEYSQQLLSYAADTDFFDLICTDDVVATRRWYEEVRPAIKDRLSEGRNRETGTWPAFLNRFAGKISAAQMPVFEGILEGHFVRRPVDLCFTTREIALRDCERWLDTADKRIMLVTGGPGAGKSVFAITLARQMHARFTQSPLRYPAPFLVWFSTSRPPVLEDLIEVTLHDLHVHDLTAEAVRFLLRQGRLLFILDGFDEISRALAHRAEDTIDKLSSEINKRTNGRLILTSRPAFLDHERIYSDLTSACEEDRPERRDIAPYSDDQQREWVIQNAPSAAESPAQHWSRLSSAFGLHSWLRDLCRIPVFLRMLSEVLVKERSIKSRGDIIKQFCAAMWERERARRGMELTDDQYLLAYEAISAAIVELGQIDARDVQDWIELYLGQDAELLLAQVRDLQTLIQDLAIGPLTGHDKYFMFEHEVLTGYFFARLMARNLKEGAPRARDLWKKPLYEPAREFLPEAITEILGDRSGAMLAKFANSSKDGLMLWNIARALGSALPKDLFKGKDLTGIVLESDKPGGQLDLRQMVFDNSNLHDVIFLRCDPPRSEIQQRQEMCPSIAGLGLTHRAPIVGFRSIRHTLSTAWPSGSRSRRWAQTRGSDLAHHQ